MATNSTTSLYHIATEVSIVDLNSILNRTSNSATRTARQLPGFEGLSIGYDRLAVGVDCDTVHSNLLIGDEETALSKLYLRHLGITHLVNAAEGNFPGMVDTSANYYADCPMVYMGIPIIDEPWYNIYQHFGVVADFIESGIKSGGRVLVHCLRGRSRSPTLVLAYLMLKMSMPAPLAVQMCCQNRAIKPNVGFMQQLVYLHNCLRQQCLLHQ